MSICIIFVQNLEIFNFDCQSSNVAKILNNIQLDKELIMSLRNNLNVDELL